MNTKLFTPEDRNKIQASIKEQELLNSKFNAILKELWIAEQVALFCEMKHEEVRKASDQDKITAISETVEKFYQKVLETVSWYIESDTTPQSTNIVGQELFYLSMHIATKWMEIEREYQRRAEQEHG